MLSQIRQISDGNHNTVFVKNKEQKFNLDKEIHDLECWKQSRNHVYRKEERELRSHLAKLRHQQEYLHHLDVKRATHHPKGSISHEIMRDNHNGERAAARAGSRSNSHLNISTSTHNSARVPPPNTPRMTLPPVQDHKALHRTEAHTNICVICQLPRRTSLKHGHHSGEVCCCEHEGIKEDHTGKGRRFTIATTHHEEHGLHGPPIEIGQRRHSLMMARLNDEKYEFRPHPPDRSHGGLHDRDNHHANDGHVHSHRGHVHEHRGHGHAHGHSHGHVHNQDPLHMHHGHVQDQHRPSHDHHGHHAHHAITHGVHARGGHAHTHHDHHPHHGVSSRHSLNHPAPSTHDHLHSAHHVPGGHHDNHNGYDARRRDHELHWDRHQVHKLRGMITDPHYKEQLELEGGRVYPWSSQYPPPTQTENFEEMQNCRYLRFSKLNLENMKDNPEEEVEVFEKKESPPATTEKK